MDLSFPGREPRGALDVDLVVDGSTLRVICTHPGLHANERTEQVGRLLASLERHPRDILIFAGDLNEWFPFSANLTALNPGPGTQPARATFSAPAPFPALDRLWVRAGRATRVSPRKIACRQARIASDHVPLCAEIFEE
jgi:endonuclease/exonuclease/phosphatase family metal-dependent hydrolase